VRRSMKCRGALGSARGAASGCQHPVALIGRYRDLGQQRAAERNCLPILDSSCRALAQKCAHSRANPANMAKKLVIFIWPQLDDDSNGEASFVVRVSHSISYAHRHQYRGEPRRHVGKYQGDPGDPGELGERRRGVSATGTTSACSSASSRPDHEDIGTVHRTSGNDWRACSALKSTP
jgi:hypothetical protein